MKELLEYIIKSIVNNPDEIEITEKESVDFPGLTMLSISVAEEDKGIVIGKKGRTINAIRDIISINAIRSDKRVRVVVEEGEKRDVSDTENKDTEEKESKDTEEKEDIFEDEI